MMKYYKDSNNLIYAYEPDGSQDHLIGNKTAITKEQADAIIAQKERDLFDALSYAEKRRSEYPSFLDYIDGVVKGDQAQIDQYIEDCQAVKAKYPKPTEE
jgi:hypothetical protein